MNLDERSPTIGLKMTDQFRLQDLCFLEELTDRYGDQC